MLQLITITTIITLPKVMMLKKFSGEENFADVTLCKTHNFVGINLGSSTNFRFLLTPFLPLDIRCNVILL